MLPKGHHACGWSRCMIRPEQQVHFRRTSGFQVFGQARDLLMAQGMEQV